jgi:succinate-acetate transporter protein
MTTFRAFWGGLVSAEQRMRSKLAVTNNDAFYTTSNKSFGEIWIFISSLYLTPASLQLFDTDFFSLTSTQFVELKPCGRTGVQG